MSDGRNRGGEKEVLSRKERFKKSITMIKVMLKGYNASEIRIGGGEDVVGEGFKIYLLL